MSRVRAVAPVSCNIAYLRSDLSDLTDSSSESGDHVEDTAGNSVSGVPPPHPSESTGYHDNATPDGAMNLGAPGTGELTDIDDIDWRVDAPGLAEAIAEELDKL